MHNNNNKNTHQSRFLEAPLVRQADGELKKYLYILYKNAKSRHVKKKP